MKQVTPISKKSRRTLILYIYLFFTLVSCYEIEPLPDKVKTNGEFAIPLIDKTVRVEEFVSFDNELLNMIEIPEGIPISMGEYSYPFYIGDYASSQTIEWVEPQIIIDTKDLPEGTKLQIKLYTKNDFGGKVYFWLPDDYFITVEEMPVKINDGKITDLGQVRDAKKVFLDISITYPTAMLAVTVATSKINIKFNMKFAIETDLSI
ncbi:MAG: hypothetical protein LBS55_14790 [Prevotellaceae bacterium]|jgi:hypothetical protein|nr:hypothetical protein [Prevotellaceae bacterium]